MATKSGLVKNSKAAQQKCTCESKSQFCAYIVEQSVPRRDIFHTFPLDPKRKPHISLLFMLHSQMHGLHGNKK